MASYLKPRRGTYSTAKNQLSTAATCLKNGEIFFELNSSGAGKGMGKIKMGDGSTSYSSLPYFLSLTDNGITFTATESTNQLSSFSSGVTIPNAFRYIRSTLSYLVTQVTNLNNDFSKIGQVTGTSKINISGYKCIYGKLYVNGNNYYQLPFITSVSDIGNINLYGHLMYGIIVINNDESINIVVSNFNGTDNTNSSILSVYGIKNK